MFYTRFDIKMEAEVLSDENIEVIFITFLKCSFVKFVALIFFNLLVENGREGFSIFLAPRGGGVLTQRGLSMHQKYF